MENKTKKISTYEKIYQQLEKEIKEGKLFGFLPGVNQLAKTFNVSPMTANRAVNLLLKNGSVQRIPRMGTLVNTLAHSTTETIAIVVADISLPLTSRLVHGLCGFFQKKGIQILIFEHRNKSELETKFFKTIFEKKIVNGIVWVPCKAGNGENMINQIEKKLIPCVAVCEELNIRLPRGESVISRVATDSYDAGYRLSGHLFDQGIKELLFLYEDRHRRQYEGILKAAQERRIKKVEHLKVEMDLLESRDIKLEKKLIDILGSYKGIIFSHDRFAAKLLKVINRSGYRVSQDFLAASFDGLEISEVLSLTTYTQPMDQIAMDTGNLLINKMKERGNSEDHYIKGEMIIRESSQFLSTLTAGAH